MLKSWQFSMFEAFPLGIECVEVVAMSRLVREKTRQQRQTKCRSSKTPIAQLPCQKLVDKCASKGVSEHIKNVAKSLRFYAGSWLLQGLCRDPPPGIALPLGNTTFSIPLAQVLMKWGSWWPIKWLFQDSLHKTHNVSGNRNFEKTAYASCLVIS